MNILTTTIVTLSSIDTTNLAQVISQYQMEADNTSFTFEIISVVSGAIAALAALTAIYLTFHSSKKDRESKRPYFTIKAPGFKQMTDYIRLQVTFINEGVHPASKFKGEIRIIQENLEHENKIDIDVVNEIPSNSPTPYYNENITLANNMPKHYIYCIISYFDPILKKNTVKIFS